VWAIIIRQWRFIVSKLLTLFLASLKYRDLDISASPEKGSRETSDSQTLSVGLVGNRKRYVGEIPINRQLY